MSIAILLDDRPSTVRILERRPTLRVAVDDRVCSLIERPARGDSMVEVEVEGRVVRAWRHVTADATYVRVEGRTHILRRTHRGSDVAGAQHVEREIRAQMPGTVVEIHCAEGEAVAAGQKLITTESMKLQHTHLASRDSVVERIICRQDASFDAGAVLILLAAEKPAAGLTTSQEAAR